MIAALYNQNLTLMNLTLKLLDKYKLCCMSYLLLCNELLKLVA